MTINPTTLEKYLRDACAGHGKNYEDGMLRMWAGCTKSVTTQQFEETFWSCAANGVPKPTDLLQAVAGIKPYDDWEVIMGVAQGRYQSGQISGYASAALRRIGGVRSIAMAKTEGKEDWTELDRLKRDFFAGLQTGGSGLPAAPEIISLSGAAASPGQQLDGGTYVDSNGKVCRNDYCDSTGSDRADSLVRLLQAGEISPKTARLLAGGGYSYVKTGKLPAAQRDRVLAVANEIEASSVSA